MRKPTKGIDYTNRDYEAYREMLIQKLQEKMPEYTDTSQTDAGIVILECLANGLDICSLYSDIIANDLFLPTTQDRKLAVLLAKHLGYTPKNQTASVLAQVFVLSSIQSEDTLIPKGTVVATIEDEDAEQVFFETVDDLIIPKGKLGDEKDDDGNYIYVVPVIQGETVEEDMIGVSNGQPYQSFQLNYPDVLVDSIELYLVENDNAEQWEQVKSLLEYDEDDKVFTVNVDEFDNCFIEFGSGVRGAIPSVDSELVVTYRVGGGEIGNVQPNTVVELVDSLAYIDTTFNPYEPSTLGHEKEDIDEIRENGPAYFRTRDRAITEQDYADLVKINFYEIVGAVAIHNGLNINMYCQVRDGYEDKTTGGVTDAMKQAIIDYFSTRIIPGTSLSLFDGVEWSLNLRVNLIIDDDYSRDVVKSEVEDFIKNSYFSKNAFTFRDKFTCSDLEREVRDTVDGVESFRIVNPIGDTLTAPNDYQYIVLGNITYNEIIGGIE